MSTIVHAWVIDGIPTIFVSDEALDDAWAVAQGFVDTKVGLRLPTNLPARVNLSRLMLEQTPTTITVDDLDDTLAALFGTAAASADALVTTLEPATDPAPVSVRGKHVGTEFIGALGERREYSCVPGFNVGMRHLGFNEAYTNGGADTPISDGPVVWTGRRCAVYRIEIVDGVAQSIADAFANGNQVWWGTLRGQGSVKQKTWTFALLGPDSWAGGNLGTGNFQDGLRSLPISVLTDDGFSGPTVMRADLQIVDMKADESSFHDYVLFLDPDGTRNMGTQTGYDAVVAELNTFLDQLIASTDNGLAYTNNADGNDLRMSILDGADGITFRWLRGQVGGQGDPFVGVGDSNSLTARLRLIMHGDVWKLLGYDPIQQVNTEGGLDAVDHADQYGRFTSVGFPAGYFQGLFYAANPKAMKGSDDNDFGGVTSEDFSSGGFDRVWPPLYPGGTFAWTGEPGQEFQLDTPDGALMAGSLARPLLEDPTDTTSAYTLGGGVGLVNRAGVFVLEGPYRRRGEEDQQDPAAGYAFDISRERKEGRTIQVIRVCWRATPGGLVTTDSDGYPRLVVQEWIAPREAGFDYEPIEGTWGGHRSPPEGAEPIRARPLMIFDATDKSDKMTTVMRRIFLATGTAGGWFKDAGLTVPLFGLGAPSAFLDVGANDDGGTIPGDGEVASLGLGIPASMVAPPEVWDAVGSIPGVHLSRCKVVAGVAADARSLLERMLAPTGLVMTYAGGKYTPRDAWSFGDPGDAVLEITPEFYALQAGADPATGVPKQKLRQWAPLDKVIVDGRIEPIGGDFFRKVEISASDPGARYRAQQVIHRAAGAHLIHPLLPIQGGSWQFDLGPRWRQAFSFWGSNHSIVPLTLHAVDAKQLWPGDIVTLTDPWLLDTLGEYGVSGAIGIVISRTYNAEAETIKFDVMMAAETDYRMYAPSAIVTEYDEAGPFRLMCLDDEYSDRGGPLDVEGFIEPSYSVEGGAADVEVFSFDAGTWTGGIFGTVSSIGTTPGSSYLELTGALTGATWLSDQHHVVVLREYGAQAAAWVLRWHAPICAEDGTHTGGQPGVKWRQL